MYIHSVPKSTLHVKPPSNVATIWDVSKEHAKNVFLPVVHAAFSTAWDVVLVSATIPDFLLEHVVNK